MTYHVMFTKYTGSAEWVLVFSQSAVVDGGRLLMSEKHYET